MAVLPSGHTAHALLPGASVTFSSLGCCPLHDVQPASDATALPANLPAGHWPHADFSLFTYLPAVHAKQPLSEPYAATHRLGHAWHSSRTVEFA